MFSLAGDKDAPIRHELMHMITTLKWGEPHATSTWLNEGLAALADDACNGFSDEQIYRFLQHGRMLLPVDSLAADFYHQPEMVAYHQAGYAVQYLIRTNGIEKFRALWARGFTAFPEIYGMPFSQAQAAMDARATADFPRAPTIDWEQFKQGCM